MAIAKLSAMRSKDPSTQVGACIVGADNRILSIGYNGTPSRYILLLQLYHTFHLIAMFSSFIMVFFNMSEAIFNYYSLISIFFISSSICIFL